MDLELIRIFVKVVELGSFTRAAQQLKLPKSTVSRGVSRLESGSGTRLLLRTTRSLKLTEAGRAFYDRCAGAVREIEEAGRGLQGADEQISGQVRLTAPEDVGQFLVSPEIRALARKYPALSFDFNFTDDVIDLVREGYDIAVRAGRLPASRMRALRLGEVAMVLVASPRYLERAPRLQGPADLASQDCLEFLPEAQVHRWKLTRSGPGPRTESVTIRPRFSGNHARSIIQLALDAGGIALMPNVTCKDELDSGKLVRVLPQWDGEKLPIYLVLPSSGPVPRRVRVVADHLAAVLKDTLKSI